MKRMALRGLTALMLVLFFAGNVSAVGAQMSSPAVSRSEGVPRFEPGDCPEEVQTRIPAGEQVRCGVLVVPEQYSKPDGPTIELEVMIIPAVTNPKSPDPVVFAQGGPGGSTIDYYSQVLFNSSLRSDRDFILFDQRGTHFSKPSLFCREIFDETVRTLPFDLPVAEADKLFNEAALACRERMAKEGVNLSAFNSVDNAKDIASLRDALGYEKINLYGVSYGTLLALHAMREEPGILRSVTIDSVVPTTIDFNFDAPNSQDRAFSELFKACREDAACAKAYPDLEKFFFDLVKRLNEKPVTIKLTDDKTGKTYPALINGDALVNGLFQMLYSSEMIPLLPKMIHNTAAGRYDLLEMIYSLTTFDRSMNYGMYFSVVCAEDGTVDPGYSYRGIREQFSKYAAEENRSMVELCKAWNVDQLGGKVDEPVKSDIPTLVFNGRFDPITPPAYGREAAKTLTNSFWFEFPNSGHGALTTSDCADSIFLDFLSDPTSKPNSSCIDSIPPVKFITDKDVIDLPLMLDLASLKGPIIWQGSLFGLGVLGMLSALVVFPILWLIRRVGNRPDQPKPWLTHLAPWLPIMNAGVLIAAAGALFAVLVLLVTGKETSFLYLGLPTRYGSLLVLAFFSLLLTLSILAFAIAGWIGKYWSLGRKIYYTFLALSALLTAVLMGTWGMFTFFM